MTVLLARLKIAAKWLLAIAGLIGTAALLYFRRKRPELLGLDPVDAALQKYERQTEVAGARYAVEVAVVRTRTAAEREQLLDILRDEDELRQTVRLIEAARKLKGE